MPPRIQPAAVEHVAKNWFSDDEYLAQVREIDVSKLHGDLVMFWANKRSNTLPAGLEKALLQVEGEKEADLRVYMHSASRRQDQVSAAEERRAADEYAENCTVETQSTGKGGIQRYVVPKST